MMIKRAWSRKERFPERKSMLTAAASSRADLRASPFSVSLAGSLHLYLFPIAALTAHLALALSVRVTAWPEVTTPAYLWSRGLLLYRDIGFQHTPGTIGTLALAFAAFGVHTWLVHAYAILPALIAHLFVLNETRSFPLANRTLASGFFLVGFFTCGGNAVWPTVVMAAWAIPVAAALSRGRMWLAGFGIGAFILFKQPAAYVLFLAVAALGFQKRFRDAGKLFVAGSAPYVLAVIAFAFLGAGRQMLRWTLEVPFTVRPEISRFHFDAFTAFAIVIGFIPLGLEALLEHKGEHATSARWLLVVAAGLALICYPRFGLLQTVAAGPCLAVGAARLMRRRTRLFRFLPAAAFAFAATFVAARGAILFLGREFDGKVIFWNEEPAFNALIARLRRLPSGTPLHSELWGNVLPRSGLLPPGGVYVNPWFDWFFPVERIGERVRKAADGPGTVVVNHGAATAGGEPVGPYSIAKREPPIVR